MISPLCSSLTGLVEDNTFVLWNLLVQPHMKFHRGLELLHLHVWKLSDLFARQAF